MKSWNLIFMMLLVIVSLSGCSSIKPTTVENVNYVETLQEENDEVELLSDRQYYMGLEETPGIKKGKYRSVQMIMNQTLLTEIFPGRVRYLAWVVNPSGKEFKAQALFAGLNHTLKPHVSVIIDGYKSLGLVDESKVILLSTGFTYVYDAGGTEYRIDNKKFSDDPKYRREIVEKYGEEIGSLRSVEGDIVKDIKNNWGYFQFGKRRFYSPLSEVQVREVAARYPSDYKIVDKYITNARAAVVFDPYSMGVSTALDVYKTLTAPSTGADYDSVITRREQLGFVTAYIAELYRSAMIREGLLAGKGNGQEKRTVAISIPAEKKVVRARKPIRRSVVNNNIWRWDRSDKDLYGRGKKTPLEERLHIEKSLKLLDLPMEVQAKVIDQWRFRKGKIEILEIGDIVRKILTKGGKVHQNVRAEWRDCEALIINVYTVSYSGKTYRIGRSIAINGHWVIL